MNILKVNLWGRELGLLSFSPTTRVCTFVFNPELKGDRPDIIPILAPKKEWESHPYVYGDDRALYQSLPPFIADSLPDSWGNTLFEEWAKQNKLSRRNISPLLKLMFIGKRGMGALEYEPAAEELEHTRRVDIASLYDLSLNILSERECTVIQQDDDMTLQSLLAVGTSAGGRQMKAIIAIDRNTGEIKSGQVDGLTDCDYFLLKFEDSEVPTTEIEMTYYEMAVGLGISMEECKILEASGAKHLLTRRFDRREGRKIYMQTLAAINPEVESYEDLIKTCRMLRLTDKEIDEVFLRMVFNVMANNTDDHNKNWSFLLEEDSAWRLSPAYDLTFIFNRFGTEGETSRCLSIGGKYRDISREDILGFAAENGIKNPEQAIDKVANMLLSFSDIAGKYNIPRRWQTIMENTLRHNLIDFGYIEGTSSDDLVDEEGRRYGKISVRLNRRGIYEVTAIVDGYPQRRFVRKNMDLYGVFENNEFFGASADKRAQILSRLFDVGRG